jgi:hypothetical protein
MGGPPTKSALGRSLGGLMKSPGEPGLGEAVSAGALSNSAGVARLLRGSVDENDSSSPIVEAAQEAPVEATAPANAASSEASKPVPVVANDEVLVWRRLVQLSLGVGDLTLISIAVWMAFSRQPFGVAESILCSAAVVVGCWLACLAIWLEN